MTNSINNRLPGILPSKGRLIDDKNGNSSSLELDDSEEEHKQSLLSRKNIYFMLEQKLKK